ncbi:hypothetical protein ANCCAN_08514 [Ancylostoma caninum]|uniref:Uncharacterized protein n=1 Tax=Ancylostoma caninum TaxID=29170 RepID=A0A368GR69_ANCCA|nr:hypothetical protein ANCCAN_08514 [Ancylostoma caninum]
MLDSSQGGRFRLSGLGKFASGALGKAKQAAAEIAQNVPSTSKFTVGAFLCAFLTVSRSSLFILPWPEVHFWTSPRIRRKHIVPLPVPLFYPFHRSYTHRQIYLFGPSLRASLLVAGEPEPNSFSHEDLVSSGFPARHPSCDTYLSPLHFTY